ncbi:MAG: glutamate-1-semialdehyde 2,1-aminomutase [Planctomycetota bacterium]
MDDAERYAESNAAHAAARAVMPGGVSSPVRAYRAVGREPVTVASGQGAWVTDVDGNRYVDYVGSYGPVILGHADPRIVAAVSDALAKGATFGMPTEAETALAATIVGALPGVDVVRFVNSGTEAAMSAIRLARAATGRNKVIKCTGCYHGHTDALLVAAGSGATTLGVPSSPGVPASVVEHTVLVPYNDLDAVRKAMQDHAGDVACMAVEPVAGNMGCIPPADGYLAGLRELCDEHDVPLLFDEVMTGFRVAWGGAQNRYGVTPDLTCLGKVMGGGLPCAAYGGREDLMRQVAPDGPVYQAGTLSGNPLAMAAGQAQLDALAADGGSAYQQLESVGAKLEAGLQIAAKQADCPVTLTRVGSMLGLFFTDAFGQRVTNYAQATACKTDRFAAFFRAMLDRGVILAPSAFEAWFVSLAHDDAAMRHTLDAAAHAFRAAADV